MRYGGMKVKGKYRKVEEDYFLLCSSPSVPVDIFLLFEVVQCKPVREKKSVRKERHK